MRKNIVIVSYNYALSKRIASILAERFDMRMFDMFEMFKFHNMPNTLADVLRINGKAFVDKKMRGILKDALEFSGIIFVADLKVVGENPDLYEVLKENNSFLFMKNDFKVEFSQRENLAILSPEEKEYFSIPLDSLNEMEQNIEKNLADFVVNIEGLTFNEIKESVLEKLKELNIKE